MSWMRVLALSAILPAGATFYFFIFWRWFDFWRRHRVATYTLMFATLGVLAVAVYAERRFVFSHSVELSPWAHGAGWLLLALVNLLGFVADRQLGLYLRAFGPFFLEQGRITLRTTGAYGVVRHPIYAAGIGYQLAVFLVTGYLAVAVAGVVFALGALWFTRREEERLMQRLDDPAEYQRYRERVPALLPWFRRR
jgi:protein-S-isoprenylcysteine O-methyltransferase Ste14